MFLTQCINHRVFLTQCIQYIGFEMVNFVTLMPGEIWKGTLFK